MNPACRKLRVRGVVQGVGFRPFVYRTAVAHGLFGSVRNLGDAGVEIVVEGDADAVDAFVAALRAEAPPLAQIASIDEEACAASGRSEFVIAPSGEGDAGAGSIPPDTAICDACIDDVRGTSRFAGYWATSCTDCGPRFTVIEGLPYDRPRTSMNAFPMCDACRAEYTDPGDRRYHAQTTACPACGPQLSFDGTAESAIARTVHAIASGEIVAVKGIGGTHIACDAMNADAVRALRTRLGRSGQPFALMATEAAAERIADIDDEERALLRSPARPIVVLRQRAGALPDEVVPGLHTVGVMLPYTGLHVLLLDRIARPLVMTSANLPGRPMLIENEEIEERLGGIVDHVLVHNRRIVARCDDSVRRRAGGKTVFLRRSRGYVPGSIAADLGEERILALGPETGLTFGLYANGAVTLSQHIGSVDDLETDTFLAEAIDHLQRLTGFGTPEIVACDLHPRFLTTRRAGEIGKAVGAKVVRVQHHAAHLGAVMAEHALSAAIGIVLDGFGYGPDGTAWGGEILVARGRTVERVGALASVRLPGGDAAAREPLRVAAALLAEAGWPAERISAELVARGLPRAVAATLLAQIDRGVNAPWTTSAGRFLDAVAAWLGVGTIRTYEGEPAMRLEAAAAEGEPIRVAASVERCGGLWRIDTPALFASLVDLAESRPSADVAATAQAALADGVARVALEVARERDVGTVALSGGVAYNDAIATRIRNVVEGGGLQYVTNEQVPCGDGGVAFGQAACAGWGWSLLEADGPDAASGERHDERAEQ